MRNALALTAILLLCTHDYLNASDQAFERILQLYTSCWQGGDLQQIGDNLTDDIHLEAKTATAGSFVADGKEAVLSSFYAPWQKLAQAEETVIQAFSIESIEGNCYRVSYTIDQPQMLNGQMKLHRIEAEELLTLAPSSSGDWAISSDIYRCKMRTPS